jgi:hypothetical protein
MHAWLARECRVLHTLNHRCTIIMGLMSRLCSKASAPVGDDVRKLVSIGIRQQAAEAPQLFVQR